jgi:hypothetical protein
LPPRGPTRAAAAAAAAAADVTLPSPLHCAREGVGAYLAHATVSVYEDRLELAGAGVVPSRTLLLPPQPPP